ncbi:MAG: nucleotidyl transferase AbiEii/AbiGii toxin family protein [Candidatus Thermoplasmatota archaeon]
MIDFATLRKVARTKGITNLGFVEKDYFQDILLLAVSRETPHLVFKGGTALYKFHGLDRFSEDMDFVGRVSRWEIARLARYVEDFGYPVETTVKEVTDGALATFAIKAFLYQGTRESMSRIRMDAVWKHEGKPATEWRTHFPMYSDIPSFRVQVMTVEEIFAEKVRALLVRSKSRDAYDAWFLLSKGIRLDSATLEKKLMPYNMELDRKTLERALEGISKRWKAEIGPMLVHLPEFREVSTRLMSALVP